MSAPVATPQTAAALTLDAIGAQLDALLELTAEASADGEVSPDLERWFEEYGALEAEKVDRYVERLRGLEGQMDAAIALAEEAQAKAERFKRQQARLLALVELYMDRRGKEKLHGKIWRFQFERTAATARVELKPGVEPAALPARFQRVKVEADKTALKAAIEHHDPEAEQLAGMVVTPAGRKLRIR